MCSCSPQLLNWCTIFIPITAGGTKNCTIFQSRVFLRLFRQFLLQQRLFLHILTTVQNAINLINFHPKTTRKPPENHPENPSKSLQNLSKIVQKSFKKPPENHPKSPQKTDRKPSKSPQKTRQNYLENCSDFLRFSGCEKRAFWPLSLTS